MEIAGFGAFLYTWKWLFCAIDAVDASENAATQVSVTLVDKTKPTIDVSEITTFTGNKFKIGNVDIQDADLVFNNTEDSTNLSFTLSYVKAQDVEAAVRAGILTASGEAGDVTAAETVEQTNTADNATLSATQTLALTDNVEENESLSFDVNGYYISYNIDIFTRMWIKIWTKII